MSVLNNICTCIFCTPTACCCGMCVDEWWGMEAQGLACVNMCSCCWRCTAPICFECKMGDASGGMGDCLKGLKYCAFSCLLCIVGPVDGIYACVKSTISSCKGSLKSFNALKPDLGFVAGKVKEMLGVQTSNEPMQTLSTYSP